jgi:acetyl esterase
MVTRDMMKWFWNHYLAKEQAANHPYAAPLRAENLGNLPSALVITAEYDPLCDEDEAYAAKLQQAGVKVKLIRYNGMIHGFFRMTTRLDKARAALDEVAGALKEV